MRKGHGLATTNRKKGNTGKRYSEDQKRNIVSFVNAQGRGGITAACKKFGVSYIALRRWMNGKVPGAPKIGRLVKSKEIDGRKMRRVKTAVTSLKLIKKQVGTLQKALKQLMD